MKRVQGYLFIVLVCLFTALSMPSCHFCRKNVPLPVKPVKDTIYPLGFCTDSLDSMEGVLRNGEVFTSLMTRLGMSGKDAYELALSSDSIFNMRKMRAGNRWVAYYDVDSIDSRSLKYLIYEEDKVNLIVFHCQNPLSARRVSKPVEHQYRVADVQITSSLWNDMLSAGVSPLLIMGLSEIYAWSIDFFTLQEGDRFRVFYSQELCDGEIIDIDTVFYAEFRHGGKEFPAIMLDRGDGGNKYWTPEGESLKKAFLKAPLKFTRISSGFSYHRKHPVTGVVKAHTGVDYAAPKGTPVMAVGDGKVIGKGWSGGGGNTIKIKHNSVYTTAYLHLSKYAADIKIGSLVSQGDIIGYVGATGTATGPHLDFRVWKNNMPINPLTMDSPSAEPLPSEMLPSLDSVFVLYKYRMDSLSVKSDSLTVAEP